MNPPTKTEIEFASHFAKEVMPLYIDTSKTYAQMAMAALGVTIIFREKVLGETGRIKLSALLLLSWSFYLLAIGASIYYQWVAVRLIEYRMASAVGLGELYFPLTVKIFWPGNAYGAMVISFFLASIFLVLASVQQLRREIRTHENHDTV